MHKIIVLCLVMLNPLVAQAAPVKQVITDAQLRGVATFRYLGLPVYEARLFTTAGRTLNWNDDFGLELTYLRGLTGYDLVESTMRELNRTGKALPVREKLTKCFQTVRKGDRYLAVSKGRDKLVFWRNDKPQCTLDYPNIKTRFMAIFLGENTRSQTFTRKLRGE